MSTLVACIGGCHVDATALVDGPVVAGSSNPARVTRSPGGVATNVARTLAALGVDVVLAGLTGDDADGHRLRGLLESEGVRLDGLGVAPGATAGYMAVIDGSGDLALGIADMESYDRLDAAWAAEVLGAIGPADIWVIDTNLTAEAIGALVDSSGDRLVLVDPVSVAKAARIEPFLDGIDVVFPDRGELEVLAGHKGGLEAQVRSVAERCDVVASLGAHGILTGFDGQIGRIPAIRPDQVVDPTGAGDALLAGYVAGLVLGDDPLRTGLAAASLVVEVEGALAPSLDMARVRRRSGG